MPVQFLTPRFIKPFDAKKKFIVILDSLRKPSPTYGPGRIFGSLLEEQYNVIWFSDNKCSRDDINLVNVDMCFFNDSFKRADEHENAREYNFNLVFNALEKFFQEHGITSVEYALFPKDTQQLILMTYIGKNVSSMLHERRNSFFDYLGNDRETNKIIEETNDRIVKNFTHYVSPIAWSQRKCYFAFYLPYFLHQTKRLQKECIFFSIDPTIYTPFFVKNGIKSRFLYFVDDTRGTRNFERCDLAQIQHITYDQIYYPEKPESIFDDPIIENSKNLFFYGRIFQEKGSRPDVWYTFLNDFRDDDSYFSIPLSLHRMTETKRDANKLTVKMPQLFTDIKNHPQHQKLITADKLYEKLKEHKYTLVIRCVSPEDSLNFRPVLAVLYNCLPLFDFRYDPENLQIPEELNNLLVVHNHSELTEKIKFFNANPDKRKECLRILRKHLRIDEYLQDPIGAAKKELHRIIPEYKI